MNSDPNPYAPPISEETEADAIHGWRVVGEVVFARRGATLPMVDLLTGNSSLSLRRLRLGASPLSALYGEQVWIYSEDNLRNRIQLLCGWLERAVFIALLGAFFFSDLTRHPWLREAVWAGLILLTILWFRKLTGKKLTIQPSVKQGWLRISPIHPKAIAYLRAAKASQDQHP